MSIKKLKHQKLNKQQLAQFAQEASTMVGLRHPSIFTTRGREGRANIIEQKEKYNRANR